MKIQAFIASLMMLSVGILSAAERVALVIGNNDYKHGMPLQNCVNDARVVSGALKKAGFEVIEGTDLGLAEMEKKVLEFRRKAKGAKAAWFHYSGHGVEVKGMNYLVPVDANVEEEFQVKHKTYALDQVLGALDGAGTPLKVVVLDCCRDNPLGRGWSRTSAQGLAQVGDTPSGTIIAYATSPGKVAADGRGENSPFTSALVTALKTPGLDVTDIFKETGRAVIVATAKAQQPWINSSFFDSFVLLPETETDGIGNVAPAETPVISNNAVDDSIPAPTSDPVLPQRGYFNLDEIYGRGTYSSYNAYTRTEILRRAQRRLKSEGHYSSSIDGDPGPATQKAIIGWQRANSMPVTGKLDDATLRGMQLESIGEITPPSPKPKPHSRPNSRPSTSAPLNADDILFGD